MNIEHKLDLIQQIHREQERQTRYGKHYYEQEWEMTQSQSLWFGTFRLRLLIAILLFLCFFVMDKKNISYGGIGANEIAKAIDYHFTISSFY